MTDSDALALHKTAAREFLNLVVAGRIEEAYRRFIDMQGRHHNPHVPEGLPALKESMIDNHSRFPGKQITIRNVVGEGDLVAAHSLIVLNPGGETLSAVHLFRFRAGRIVEMWDCVQPVPADLPNKDGAF